MAITKNTAKAPAKATEEKKVTKAAAPAPKAEAKAPAASKTAKVTKAPAAEKAVEAEAPAKVETLSRKDIAAALRDKVMATGAAISPKVAETCAVAYEEVLQEALAAGKKVSLPGFGVFSVVAKAEQERPNPQKPGEKITIKAHNAPKFKAGSKLKQAVNGGEEAGDDEAGE